MIKFRNTSNIKKINYKWVTLTILWTFLLSVVVNAFSSLFISDAGFFTAVIVLLLLIFIGFLFDLVATAMMAADETPFHSMATKRVRAAKQALFLIRNAEKVANFCGDVVGDIVGIASGVAASVIIAKFAMTNPTLGGIIFPLVFTALVAAATVGSKAIGKSFAIRNANGIVYFVAMLMTAFKK